MAVNKFKPHILVLPEDDANRQLANGFFQNIPSTQIQVLPEAGGWLATCDNFRNNHISSMMNHSGRHMVLLID